MRGVPHPSSALYTVLTGRPAEEALELVARKGAGSLYTCSQPFVEAMTDASLLGRPPRGGGRRPGRQAAASVSAQHEAWRREWMRIGGWPRGVETTTHRFVADAVGGHRSRAWLSALPLARSQNRGVHR